LVDVDRGRLFCYRFLAVRRRSLAGGVFVLALAFALEGGRGFPVARRAGGDAELGGDRLLCHSLGEQLRRPLLFSGSLLALRRS
jgi:hypothetical protein